MQWCYIYLSIYHENLIIFLPNHHSEIFIWILLDYQLNDGTWKLVQFDWFLAIESDFFTLGICRIFCPKSWLFFTENDLDSICQEIK